MAETLRGLGFSLVRDQALLDLDKTSIEQAVRLFGRMISGSTVALFYYAGHGLQIAGENYLVPVEANPTRAADADFELVDANLVLRQVEGAGPRLNLIILDACRNNPFGGRGLREVGTGLASNELAYHSTMNGALETTLIPSATNPELKSLLQTGLKIFEGHEQHAEQTVGERLR